MIQEVIAIPRNREIGEIPFPGWPSFEADEIDAAVRVLQSGNVNYWTGGEGREFEREFANFVHCRHAVAVTNGSVALEVALHALGIGPGDEVVTPSRSFIASSSCIANCGAHPIFADVDRDCQNITAQTIKAALTPATKAIIAVHLAGWPCDMDPILEVAEQRSLKVIEDCSQAHGATYKGRPVGSFGNVAAFSFCHDKIMTTGGEGGMLTTNDPELWERAWAFKDHGKSYDAVHNRQHPPGFRWLHETFGTNGRLTEMQSAIGRAQLRKLPRWVRLRRKYAAQLNEHLSAIPAVRLTIPPAEFGHSYYKYYLFIEPDHLNNGWNRDRIMSEINSRGVPCYSGACSEIYREKVFPPEWRPKAPLPVARELGDASLMLLVHPTLSEAHVHYAGEIVANVIRFASA